MKQISDVVFAQVRDAMVIAKNFCGSCTAEDCPDTVAIPINQALAALDTAQPEQVNAMLVEALKELVQEKCDYMLRNKLGNPEIEHTTRQARAALTAAKQAQPVCGYDDKTGNCTRVNCCKQAQPARPINCGTGHCSCIDCPYEQAQPERAPLSDDEIQTIYLRTYNEGFHGRNLEIAFARAIEAAIKQGGQQ